MKHISSSTRTAALAGILGLAAAMATVSSASARSYTQCDYDGDDCVRVHCDWDADDCQRESLYSYRSYYDRDYNRDYNRDYDRGYYGGYYHRYGERHWVCDADGDSCQWRRY